MAKAKIELSKQDKLIAAGSSYVRAAVAAVVALYLSGNTDPEALLNAFIAGFAGPAIKYFDPKAKEFGKGSK